MDQTVTFMSTGKEVVSCALSTCCAVPSSSTHPGVRKKERGCRRPYNYFPLSAGQWQSAKMKCSALPYLHFIFSPPDKWVVFCHDHFALIFRPVVAFSLLMAEQSLSAPDSIRSYYQDQGNRLGESMGWPCCWDAKCAMECAECHVK